AVLRPFLPAGGKAQVIITSNQRSVAALGAGVPVDVFTEAQALTFLAARTGLADAAGAAEQAAAVIAAQHLTYATYLERLRRLPVETLRADAAGADYSRRARPSVLLGGE